MKKLWIALFSLLIVFLNGCLPSKEIESLGIINTRGVDLREDGSLKTTIVYFQFDAQSKEIAKIVFGVGDTVKGARANANLKTNFELTPGQIRLELYGLEAAKKGLSPYLDTLSRDAKVADTMFLAVSNTTAKEVITIGKDDLSLNVGRYLYRLVEQTVTDDIIPRTTLQDFIHKYYDVGKDPVLPMLKIKEGRPYLYAVAIFKGDKYVGKMENADAFLLNVLEKKVSNTILELKLPLNPIKEHLIKPSDEESFSVLLTVLNGHGKTELTDFNNLEFETQVEMKLRLMELTKDFELDHKFEALLEKEIEKSLQQQYSDLLKKVQELNADPFGYGSIYRIHKKTGDLTDKEWRSLFPDIQVKFNVNAKIIRHGITE